jgi:hypothetical protein
MREIEKKVNFLYENQQEIKNNYSKEFLELVCEELNRKSVKDSFIGKFLCIEECNSGEDFEDLYHLDLSELDINEIDSVVIDEVIDDFEDFEEFLEMPYDDEAVDVNDILDYLYERNSDRYYEFVGYLVYEFDLQSLIINGIRRHIKSMCDKVPA